MTQLGQIRLLRSTGHSTICHQAGSFTASLPFYANELAKLLLCVMTTITVRGGNRDQPTLPFPTLKGLDCNPVTLPPYPCSSYAACPILCPIMHSNASQGAAPFKMPGRLSCILDPGKELIQFLFVRVIAEIFVKISARLHERNYVTLRALGADGLVNL
jgi:hypothetical protein